MYLVSCQGLWGAGVLRQRAEAQLHLRALVLAEGPLALLRLGLGLGQVPRGPPGEPALLAPPGPRVVPLVRGNRLGAAVACEWLRDNRCRS